MRSIELSRSINVRNDIVAKMDVIVNTLKCKNCDSELPFTLTKNSDEEIIILVDWHNCKEFKK